MANTTGQSKCSSCKIVFKDGENIISCEGFCKTKHHYKCVRDTVNLPFPSYQTSDNLRWYCDICTGMGETCLAQLLAKLENVIDSQTNNNDKLDYLIEHSNKQNNVLLTKIEEQSSIIMCLRQEVESIKENNSQVKKSISWPTLTTISEPKNNNVSMKDKQGSKVNQDNKTQRNLHNNISRGVTYTTADARQQGQPRQVPGAASRQRGSTGKTAKARPPLGEQQPEIHDDAAAGRQAAENERLNEESGKRAPQREERDEGVRAGDDEGGFREAKTRRRWRKPQVVGTATDPACPFKGAKRTAHLYVGRLEGEVADTAVKDFVESILSDVDKSEINVEKLSSRGTLSSFHLSFPLTHLDKIQEASLWPNGVFINRYFPQKNFQLKQKNPVQI